PLTWQRPTRHSLLALMYHARRKELLGAAGGEAGVESVKRNGRPKSRPPTNYQGTPVRSTRAHRLGGSDEPILRDKLREMCQGQCLKWGWSGDGVGMRG